MTDHVSGPWHVQEFKKHPDIKRIIDKNGSFIADADYRPNARLIAAAPDLLDVARESQRLLDILVDSLANAGLENEADVSAEFAMVIRAAIAKATGQ